MKALANTDGWRSTRIVEVDNNRASIARYVRLSVFAPGLIISLDRAINSG